MKILVINGYTRENKGDAALMSVMCRTLQDAYPSASIRIASMEHPDIHPKFEEWENVGSLRLYSGEENISRVQGIARKLLVMGIAAGWTKSLTPIRQSVIKRLPKSARGELQAIEEADLIVSVGGGYLNGKTSISSDLSVFFLLVPIHLSSRLKKCIVCGPQSIGAFGSKFQSRATGHVLRKVPLILARESTSVEVLADMNIKDSVHQAVDSAFLFKTSKQDDLRAFLGVPATTQLAGITVRKWLDPKKQEAYEIAIAKAADHLIETYGMTVVFIPQVTSDRREDDDRITSREVHERMEHKDNAIVIEDSLDYEKVKALYRDLDLIIGTRFHSVIFSLTSYIPAVAIRYEHKTSGIMKDLGLSKWVINIEDITAPKMIKLLDQLVSEKDSYVSHLHKVIPDYIQQAHEATKKIQDVYERHHL